MSILKRFAAVVTACFALSLATAFAGDPTVYLSFDDVGNNGLNVLNAKRGNAATVRKDKGSTLVEGLGLVTLCNGEGITSGSGAVEIPKGQHLAIEHGIDASKSWYLAMRFRVPSSSSGYVSFYSLNNNGDAALFKKSNSTAIGSSSWSKNYSGSLTYNAWQTLVVVGKVNDGNSAEVFLDGTSINTSSKANTYDLSGKSYIYIAADDSGEDNPIQFDWILVGQGGSADYEECYQKMMAGEYDAGSIDVFSSNSMNLGVPEPAYGTKKDVADGNVYTFTMTTPVVVGNGFTATCTGWTLVDSAGVETSGPELTKTVDYAGGYYALTWNWELEWVVLTASDYVQSGLVAQWDGVDNAGTGEHDATSAIWKDLTGGMLDWTLDLTKCSWADDALVFNEKRQPGTMPYKSANDFKNKITTTEFVYKNEGNRHGIIFNPGFSGTAMLYTDTANHVGFHGPSVASSWGNAVSLNTINSFSVRYNRTGDTPSGVNCNWLNGAPGTKVEMNDSWSGGLGVPCLGGRSTDDAVNVKGRLFALRIYNRDLTDDEIARNYRIDDYRFRGGEFPGDLKFLRLSAADGTTEAKDVTFTDLATGEALPYEDFDVSFSESDTDGNVTITAIGKEETDYAGVSGRCKVASGILPYFPIDIGYPTNLVDVTIVGAPGKVKGDTYEFGSQVTITVAAKDGTSPFVKWVKGVPAEDALNAAITFTVGEKNDLVPWVALPWVYEGGALYDGYFTVSASCAADGVSLTLNNAKAPQHHFASVTEIDFTKPIAGGYSLVGIGYQAFLNDARVTTVRLPDTVTTLGGYAFAGCTMMKDLYGTSNFEVLGSYAFQQCSVLRGFEGTDDVILTNLKSIARAVFSSCPGLKGKVVLDGDEVAFDTSANTSLGLFEGCAGIKEAVIGDGISAIGTSPFYRCSALTNLTVGAGLGGNLPRQLAYECGSLKTFSSAVEVTSIGVGAFEWCKSLVSFNGSTDLVLENLESIGKAAFANCSSLAGKVVISGKDIEYIDDQNHGFGFFEGCSNIKEAYISGLDNLRGWTFLDCGNLTNVVIKTGLTEMPYGDRMFGNCGKLANVSLDAFPSTSSSANAFRNDKNGGRYPAKTKRFEVPPTAEWMAFLENPDYVTPWAGAELSDADKATYETNYSGRKKPYGLIKVDTADGAPMPINQWIGLIPQEGTLMFIK